ncbi:MAG: 3-keto-disaccharide hydrolase [Ramlibacter sp.]
MRHAQRVAVLVLAAGAALAGCAMLPGGGGGWQTLIDGGRGMENFTTVGGANWRAEADAIVADRRPDTLGTHYLTTRNSYKDFALRAEFWVSEDANSGIYVRCTEVRPMTDRSCHEANIFDKRADPSYATGAIVWLARAPSPVPLAGGKWNTMEVTARGTKMTVVLNGVKTAETDEARDAAGVIGLQYAGGVVKYRKLQIRPL